MINSGLKRTILRWIHLIVVIPTLGFIYGDPAEVAQYASAVRYIFVPVLMFSGYWMYAGPAFAVVGVATWLGVFQYTGTGAAIVSQMIWFALWKIGQVIRARRAKVISPPTT